jgi:hypothetical protein
MKWLLVKLRQVPLVGWLVFALAAVVLLWLRARRTSVLERQRLKTAQALLVARRKYEAAVAESTETKAVECVEARREFQDKVTELDDIETALDQASGEKLADDLNKLFTAGAA